MQNAAQTFDWVCGCIHEQVFRLFKMQWHLMVVWMVQRLLNNNSKNNSNSNNCCRRFGCGKRNKRNKCAGEHAKKYAINFTTINFDACRWTARNDNNNKNNNNRNSSGNKNGNKNVAQNGCAESKNRVAQSSIRMHHFSSSPPLSVPLSLCDFVSYFIFRCISFESAATKKDNKHT